MYIPNNRQITDIAMATALAGILAVSISACSNSTDSVGDQASSSSVGNVIDDSLITTRIKSALMANPKINSYDFKVETRKGDVLISGFVNNQVEIDMATVLIKAVDGVKTIQNNVVLKNGSTTIGNKVDDGITSGRVKAALLADPSIHSLDIRVVTRMDEVQLSGFVNNQQQLDLAMQLAAHVQGVQKVSSEMQIKK